MSIEENIQTVKNLFIAMGSGDRQRLLSLVSEDIEWIRHMVVETEIIELRPLTIILTDHHGVRLPQLFRRGNHISSIKPTIFSTTEPVWRAVSTRP